MSDQLLRKIGIAASWHDNSLLEVSRLDYLLKMPFKLLKGAIPFKAVLKVILLEEFVPVLNRLQLFVVRRQEVHSEGFCSVHLEIKKESN